MANDQIKTFNCDGAAVILQRMGDFVKPKTGAELEDYLIKVFDAYSITPAQFMRLFQISYKTYCAMRREGNLPRMTLLTCGGEYRILLTDLAQWIEQGGNAIHFRSFTPEGAIKSKRGRPRKYKLDEPDNNDKACASATGDLAAVPA